MANYQAKKTSKGLILSWTNGVRVEQEAIDQLVKVADMFFVKPHVAAMPDVHAGMGATIGSVIPTVGYIIPAAVGVDIGCGMIAQKTNLHRSDIQTDAEAVFRLISRYVPHGVGMGWQNSQWRNVDRPQSVTDNASKMLDCFLDLECASLLNNGNSEGSISKLHHQLATLGSGNHFIEVCYDENDNIWFVIHSGSRSVGNNIGSYYIKLAMEQMDKWGIVLEDKHLAYLPEGDQMFDDYIRAATWAQDYARDNRIGMLEQVKVAVKTLFPKLDFVDDYISCHHNFVEKEHHFQKNVWLTRKGATRARKGDLGIIPGSMGAKSYIVEGKGNAQSFHSCSHGAGRAMSRTKAKKTITLDEHRETTDGVFCKKDSSVLDESPKAYKDIDAVMAAQSTLVKIRHTLKQLVCVKG